MAYSREWEMIEYTDERRIFGTQRLQVPGGWLVRTGCYHFGQVSVAIVFFADASHLWELE